MTPDQVPTAADQPTLAQPPALERYALIAVLVLYFVAQANASLHHGSYGQDFGRNTELAVIASKTPLEYIRNTYKDGYTNPPLYALFCGLVYKLTKGIHYLAVIALLQSALNTWAFALFYRVLEQLIRSPVMRLSCFVFMLFIPFSRTVAVVLAADGFAIPFFLITLYFLGRLIQARSWGEYATANAGIVLFLLLGVFTKYMFISTIAVAILSILLLWRVGALYRWWALASLASVVIIPGVCGFAEYRICMRNPHLEVAKSWINPFTSPYMNVRSIVFPRVHDAHVLSAPAYDEPNPVPEAAQPEEVRSTEGRRFNLLIHNKYSYPALLHLGVFTDILNVFQYDPKDTYFGTRSVTNAGRMRLAVKTGLLFSLCAFLALPIMLWRGLYSTIISGDRRWVLLLVTLLMSCAWFANIVVFFPFIPETYGHGFWLPRLVAPALLGFIAVSFVWLDTLLAKRARVFSWVCLLAVVLQSGLHFSFLWPWGVY
jgi:hypothetical protein